MMEKTWRWFGPNDIITLENLRQIGVEGIVTALHDIPNGKIWPLDEISKMKHYIESRGLRSRKPAGKRGNQICRSATR